MIQREHRGRAVEMRRSRTIMTSLAILAGLTVGKIARADGTGNPTGELSNLGNLAAQKSGRPRHEGSRDRSGAGNDFRRVNAGQTITLLDVHEAGIIRRFWMTAYPRSVSFHRQAILRMYWDGETTPSVEVPIGDFFGVGFGEQVDYQSLPLSETSGGYNCYWPMPFHASARWTLTNLSSQAIDAFFYNIDYTAYDSLPPELLQFHAQWRRENPTTPRKSYTILEATGTGHIVGTALFMQGGTDLAFLEGNERITIDGEAQPSVIGTGTEDYFGGGFFFEHGPYSAPEHGCLIRDAARGQISAYRWHIDDAMPFSQSIQVSIEHGNGNRVRADYSSVAYWYQREPHAPFPPLPPPAGLLPE
jgi:D-arabinan exo alpha-(1,3)/(1,5)-arabinofuranosidase (non-reducing end)